MNAGLARRRLLVPEVVQTSAMDCGPASLKCLLEGHGIQVSYGRLREACQTDVDGTSIDTMEEVAMQLGLDAEQVMVPADHVLLPEAQMLPAIAVVRQPNGTTHFVVLWRRHGRLIQLMDPATGRRWSSCESLLEELYIHRTPVPAETWTEWARSAGLLEPLGRRLADLGLGRAERKSRLARAVDAGGWRPLAALDAGTRFVSSVVLAGGLRRGRQAAQALGVFVEKAEREEEDAVLPAAFWSVRPAPPGEDGEARLELRGAVLVHVRGKTSPEAPAGKPALSPELVRALEEAPARPGRMLLQTLRQDGLLAPAVLAAAFALAATGLIVEALLFRGLLDLGRELDLAGQRLGAVAALIGFLGLLLVLELPLGTGLLRFGRHLEARLRLAFLEKIPRLGDRYFQSRLISDMADRGHSLNRLRLLPQLGGQLVQLVFELLLTTAGIIWLDPASAPLALLAGGFALGLPLAVQSTLKERDLRLQNHGGALGRFYLDALLGLLAIRAHGAERPVRREHEALLVEWARAGLGMQRAAVLADAVQAAAGFGLAGALLFAHVQRGGGGGGVLLLVFWALNLPTIGLNIALLARQYPNHRNVTLRLLEPLGAIEEAPIPADAGAASAGKSDAGGKDGAADLAFEAVSVRAAGHTILQDIDLRIPAGSHVAIVGPSGAGKSSFVGLLLGWHRPAAGRVVVDGAPLGGAGLETLRRQTAWVDPAVQLWNRSFLENLRYGSPPDAPLAVGQAIEAAELRSVLEKLPDGLQTPLGEGGALVSGGEGQRVRLGRAMLKPGVRLVLLDEPFRGLDREKRRELLGRARRLWQGQTLLCVTHDVGETRGFERVLVIEAGRVVEDGVPAELAERPDSRYRALLVAEEAVRTGLWSSASWRRLRMEGGRLR